MVAFAQTTKTPLEGVTTFGPLILPISAYLVSLLFEKRVRARRGHVEDGSANRPGGRTSVDARSNNASFALQYIPAANNVTQREEDDVGTQMLGAVLSAPYGL